MKYTTHTTTTHLLELNDEEFTAASTALEETIRERLDNIEERGSDALDASYLHLTAAMIRLSDQFPGRIGHPTPRREWAYSFETVAGSFSGS